MSIFDFSMTESIDFQDDKPALTASSIRAVYGMMQTNTRAWARPLFKTTVADGFDNKDLSYMGIQFISNPYLVDYVWSRKLKYHKKSWRWVKKFKKKYMKEVPSKSIMWLKEENKAFYHPCIRWAIEKTFEDSEKGQGE